VNKNAVQCSLCKWTSRCHGCAVLPTEGNTALELVPDCDLYRAGSDYSGRSLF
jgi:hypothetical protein